jgi:hypothetical protein
MSAGRSAVWAISEALCELTDLEQELAKFGEAFGSELLRPGSLNLGDCFPDHADRRVTACGEGDAF